MPADWNRLQVGILLLEQPDPDQDQCPEEQQSVAYPYKSILCVE